MNQDFSHISKNGYIKEKLNLENCWIEAVEAQNWQTLDQLCFQMLKKGDLRKRLSKIVKISQVEHILSLREEPDEEGIWHDDGSRKLAFSVSLNLIPQSITGGQLEMRPMNSKENITTLENLEFGEYYIFATGQNHWQHRTKAVISGKRLVFAGWCT